MQKIRKCWVSGDGLTLLMPVVFRFFQMRLMLVLVLVFGVRQKRVQMLLTSGCLIGQENTAMSSGLVILFAVLKTIKGLRLLI